MFVSPNFWYPAVAERLLGSLLIAQRRAWASGAAPRFAAVAESAPPKDLFLPCMNIYYRRLTLIGAGGEHWYGS